MCVVPERAELRRRRTWQREAQTGMQPRSLQETLLISIYLSHFINMALPVLEIALTTLIAAALWTAMLSSDPSGPLAKFMSQSQADTVLLAEPSRASRTTTATRTPTTAPTNAVTSTRTTTTTAAITSSTTISTTTAHTSTSATTTIVPATAPRAAPAGVSLPFVPLVSGQHRLAVIVPFRDGCARHNQVYTGIQRTQSRDLLKCSSVIQRSMRKGTACKVFSADAGRAVGVLRTSVNSRQLCLIF